MGLTDKKQHKRVRSMLGQMVLRRKINQGKKMGSARVGGDIRQVVRGRLMEEVTSEQRPEGGKGEKHAGMWGKGAPDGGNGCAKALGKDRS